MPGVTVYSQHARGLPQDVKGKAAVVFATWPKGVVPNSPHALKRLGQLLGHVDVNGKPVAKDKQPTWDLIHVNLGLGDLVYRVPGLEDFRVLPIDSGGVVATSPDQYRKNLDQLITQLKKTGAKVVWASTARIRDSRSNVFKLGSEIEYNAIAAEVMAKHRVPTNDMYIYVKHLVSMDKPASHGVAPFSFDKKPIHMPIVRVIEQHFGLEAMPVSEEEQAVKEAMKKPPPRAGLACRCR